MEFLPAKVAHKEISMARMMTRPTMHDLVKEAMAGTVSKVDITAEAARQLGHPMTPQEQTKTAAQEGPAVLPDEVIEKYAAALEHLAKEAADPGSAGVASPGVGPGQGAGQVMDVLEAKAEGDGVMEAGQSGQAISKDVPPKDPPMTTFPDNKGAANAMDTNLDMEHGEQPVDPMHNGTASNAAQKQAQVNLMHLLQLTGQAPAQDKTASLAERNMAMLTKMAEDAINPAQISGGQASAQGADEPDGVSGAEEGPVPPVPADASRQQSMVASNQAAIDYKKRQAKAQPKKELGHLIDEPALSAAHDKVLHKAWNHTDQAGAKIASAKLTKTAAAHALLLKLAEEAEDEKKKKGAKKEKQSNVAINAALGTSEGQSGFSAPQSGNAAGGATPAPSPSTP
jgi:hypothetical protein